MHTFRRWYRFTLALIHVIWGILLLLFAVGPDPEQRTARDWKIINRWMARLCAILGLRIQAHGKPAEAPVLFVANHISWHDILVMQAFAPTGFIAKREIRDWPVIGWMAYRGNTLFIRRGRRESLFEIKAAMEKRLQENQSIVIFPEGGTSTGEKVLPFRSRLYDPAIDLNIPIQAVALHYSSPDNHSKDLAFVDDEKFLTHAFRVMGEKQIDITVHFCTPIHPDKQDRRTLAQITHTSVANALESEINMLSTRQPVE